jgi:hypothetical protein
MRTAYYLLASAWLASQCLAGCSRHATPLALPEPGQAPAAAAEQGFQLRALDDPMLAQDPGALSLKLLSGRGGVAVQVSTTGAAGLRAVYIELAYDATRYAAESIEPGLLGGQGETLQLSLLDAPGVARYGEVLIHPQAHSGFSGDGVLATLHFQLRRVGEAAAAPLHAASSAPGNDACRAILSWDAGAQNLDWDYYNQGDYNQDGAVGLTDLTPLGIHFGETGPFSVHDAISVVDGNGDQAIGLPDVTPIGINYRRNAAGGYQVFEALDTSLYPANEEPSMLGALSATGFNAHIGNPAQDRLHYQANVPAPVPQSYYWVRPVDSQGNEGTPSTIAGGPPAALPTLSLTDPPALGNGTSGNPYVAAPNAIFHLKLVDPVDGDVTLSPNTEYFVASPEMADLDQAAATITIGDYYVGVFMVQASYQHVLANALYINPVTTYTWGDMDIDQGTPTSSNVGKHCSLADIGGQPGVAYYDETAGALRYAYFTLLPMPTWHASVVDNAGVVGLNCTLMDLGGKAAICYFDQTHVTLKFAYANTATPSGPADWAVHTVLPSAYASETDMHLSEGTVAIVINDALLDKLLYIRTYEAVPVATTDWVLHAVAGSGDSAAPSLEIVNGVPAIAYYDASSMDLRYCYGKSVEPHDSGEWVSMAVDSADAVGVSPQLYAMDGIVPVIAYYDWTHGDLKFAQAKNMAPLSAADWTLTYVCQSPDFVGNRLSLDGVNGHLCIAFQDYTDGSIWFARNKTPWPRGPQDWQVYLEHAGPNLGDYLSIAELFGPINGVPGIAYYDSAAGDLRFALGQ